MMQSRHSGSFDSVSDSSSDSSAPDESNADVLREEMVLGDIVNGYVRNSDSYCILMIVEMNRYDRPSSSKNKKPLFYMKLRDLRTFEVYGQQMQVGDPFVVLFGDALYNEDDIVDEEREIKLSEIEMNTGTKATRSDKRAKYEAYLDPFVSAVCERYPEKYLRSRYLTPVPKEKKNLR